MKNGMQLNDPDYSISASVLKHFGLFYFFSLESVYIVFFFLSFLVLILKQRSIFCKNKNIENATIRLNTENKKHFESIQKD